MSRGGRNLLGSTEVFPFRRRSLLCPASGRRAGGGDPGGVPVSAHQGVRQLPARTVAAVVLAAMTLLSGCQAGGDGAPLELKFGHVGAPGSLFALSAEEFARRANERLGENARVMVFGSGQLGGDRTVLQKLKLGTVDLAIPSTVMSSAVDAFALFEMPYLVRDRDHLLQIEEELFWSELAPRAEAEGYHVLALWENGFRHVTNNTRPILEPADLQGIKIRTPTSPWRVRLFTVLGASPSPMPFSEVFVALQTGVMDGQENPLTNISNAGFQEVQEYLSLTGHVYSPAYLTAGAQRWLQLPESVRQVLTEVADETQAFVFGTARQMDARLLEELRAGGMEVNEVDRDSFARASKEIYREFGEQVPGGAQWISRALNLGRSDQ